MGRAWIDKHPFTCRSTSVDGIDSLKQHVDGANSEIVQIGRGLLGGRITKASIGDTGFSLGSFSQPIRASGVMSSVRVIFGVLLACDGPVTTWSEDVISGDIFVIPPGFDHYDVYGGATQFAALSIDPIELAMLGDGSGPLSDPQFWMRRHHLRPRDARAAKDIERRLRAMFAMLTSRTRLPPSATHLLGRSAVEAFARHFAEDSHDERCAPIASAAKIVKAAEEFAEFTPDSAVNVGRLCRHLKMSRRTLYRCFEEVLGVGPSTFLRNKRLCRANSALLYADPSEMTVHDIAYKFGFVELGRFSKHYRDLFGEFPRETLAR